MCKSLRRPLQGVVAVLQAVIVAVVLFRAVDGTLNTVAGSVPILGSIPRFGSQPSSSSPIANQHPSNDSQNDGQIYQQQTPRQQQTQIATLGDEPRLSKLVSRGPPSRTGAVASQNVRQINIRANESASPAPSESPQRVALTASGRAELTAPIAGHRDNEDKTVSTQSQTAQPKHIVNHLGHSSAIPASTALNLTTTSTPEPTYQRFTTTTYNDSNASTYSHGAQNLTTLTQLKLRRSLAADDAVPPECEFLAISKPTIYGIRCDEAEDESEDGAIYIKAHHPTRVLLIGRNLSGSLSVALTPNEGTAQDDCTHSDRIKSLQLLHLTSHIGEVYIDLPSPGSKVPLYFCLREPVENARWFHQGSEPWLKVYVQQELMPLYMKLLCIACLLLCSGLFSGLNLGLMALDKNDLAVIMKCGSENEKRYARTIEPVRRRGNYLLCSILFSNTLINSTISVLLEDLSSGFVAVCASTILIVMFGEILPQAFCSRYGLAVGAKTIYITYACMAFTSPLSYAVAYCLDLALGEEIGHAYDRERLMEFIKVTRDTNNLETDEVNIIAGALKIKKVPICEIMTRIEDVYMLDTTAVLDFDTIQSIVEKGYSRIPVHEAGDRKNIVAMLFAKDLALVDPDDRTPVQTMISFYSHPIEHLFEDATLDQALNLFKTGKSHLAFVQRVIQEGDRDPYYEITGIVTLEDVIEEIMQMEINDETDTLTDNRRKRRRKDAQVRKDFSHFTNLGSGDSSFNVVTPQLCLAAYQFLATTVEPFSAKYLSDTVLKRLLSQRIFYKVKADDDESARQLYTAGQPADYFVMILEGRVQVVCGEEGLLFDGGPFSFFGKAALSRTETTVESLATTSTPSKQATTNLDVMTTSGVAESNESPLQQQASTSRRESSTAIKPTLSRRESIVKAIPGLSRKVDPKLATETSTAVEMTAIETPQDGAAGGACEVQSLMESIVKNTNYFVPDYTVTIITNTSYLKVTRRDYLTALRATLIDRDTSGNVGGGGGSIGGDIGGCGDAVSNAELQMMPF